MKAAPLVLAGLLLLTLAIAGCGSGKPETSGLPQILEARAERIVTPDGEATLASTITIEFDRPAKLEPGQRALASFFELSMEGASAQYSRVLVQQAEATASGREVTLGIDAVIADGSTLKVAKRLFGGNTPGDIQVRVASEFSPAQVVLATTALGIANPALLDDPTVPEVTAADRDPAVQREALEAHLRTRGSNAETTQAALARFDAIPPAIVPSPKLRAALAALTGTFAEPAIDSLLTSGNCTGKPAARILFQPPPDMPKLLARVTYDEGGARIISINPSLEGGRFEHVMPLLAHESIHCDQEDKLNEEVAATAFDTFLYTQLIAADPGLVSTNTPAAREMNVDAVAFINSGRRLPESVGVLPSVGVTAALPDTNAAYRSFAELAAEAYPTVEPGTSPPEPVAQAYVEALAAHAGMPADNAFNLKYLDALLGRAMDPRTLARAIAALGLEPQ